LKTGKGSITKKSTWFVSNNKDFGLNSGYLKRGKKKGRRGTKHVLEGKRRGARKEKGRGEAEVRRKKDPRLHLQITAH